MERSAQISLPRSCILGGAFTLREDQTRPAQSNGCQRRRPIPKHMCVHQDFLFGSRTSENDPNKDRIFRKRGSLSLLGHVVTSLCIT